MSTEFVTMIRQFVCGLHGHDSLLQFERGRLSLKCTSCGHESPGWEIKSRRDAASAPVTPAQPAAARRRLLPHFAGARRLA
jgi:hypothetical protein